MSILFDLTTGEQSESLEIPKGTNVLFGTKKLLSASAGTFTATQDESGLLTKITLKLTITPSSFQRIQEAGTWGFNPDEKLEDTDIDIMLTVNPILFDKHKSNWQEASSLSALFQTKLGEKEFPLFLDLRNYTMERVTQTQHTIASE